MMSGCRFINGSVLKSPVLDVETRGDASGAREPSLSTSHLVIIPSFNSGRLLASTVAAARMYWAPVWVVVDGSTDGSGRIVEAMARSDPALRVLQMPVNGGKGAAVRHGMIAARSCGFTHALVMDADGQHPPERIPTFMEASSATPEALVMGRPIFGPDAPWERVTARRLSNAYAAILTARYIGDTLFGFRVYPIGALLSAMRTSQGMRRFDFDPEAVVRLVWDATPLVQLYTPVRYLSQEEDGVSHFRYLRDNVLLTRMYLRLTLVASRRLLYGAAGWHRGKAAGQRQHEQRRD